MFRILNTNLYSLSTLFNPKARGLINVLNPVVALIVVVLHFALFPASATAQTTDKLIAYYSFDDCTANDSSGNGRNGIVEGNPGCDCGVQGDALMLDGTDDYVLLLGFDNFFITTDFTISFYMKATSPLGTQDLISKREACDENHAFSIRYTPSSNIVTTNISETATKKAAISEPASFQDCWHHVTYVRSSFRTKLYLNGELAGESNTDSRVDLANNAVLQIANSPCLTTTDNRFAGLIDELRIYNRALRPDEIRGLYLIPDRIGNRDTLIFLGNTVQAFVPNSCADTYNWSPVSTVSDPFIANPVLSPTQSTTYTLQLSDEFCVAEDSLKVTVIDPADLDCNETFLPNAFTPNGDGRNETFRISNPFAIDLITFEIFDRWGSRVFMTDTPLEGWDGSFKGQELNPGVLLYRVRFRCNGEERVSVGNFSLIR